MATRTIALDGAPFVTWEENREPGGTIDCAEPGAAPDPQPGMSSGQRLIKVPCGKTSDRGVYIGFHVIGVPDNDMDAAQTAVALVKQFGPPVA